MRSGDTVLHLPSQEKWTVAYAEGDYLAWYGWPPGEAKVSDCQLLESCTDKEHEESLRRWAALKDSYNDRHASDRRPEVCSRQLFELVKGYVGAHI